jgi:hypothetical protein
MSFQLFELRQCADAFELLKNQLDPLLEHLIGRFGHGVIND